MLNITGYAHSDVTVLSPFNENRQAKAYPLCQPLDCVLLYMELGKVILK